MEGLGKLENIRVLFLLLIHFFFTVKTDIDGKRSKKLHSRSTLWRLAPLSLPWPAPLLRSRLGRL